MIDNQTNDLTDDRTNDLILFDLFLFSIKL